MANKRYDVSTPREKKDGSTFWHRVGTAFQGERGIQVIFDSLPLPDKDGRVVVSLFEPREDSGRGGGQRAEEPRRSAPAAFGGDGDGVPF